MKRRLAAAVIALPLLVFSLVPVTASASAARENLSGIETGVPQPSGLCPVGADVVLSPFAGTAGGSIAGTWTAAACHGDLPSSVGQSIPLLPGGSFTVNGFTSSGRYVPLYGAFGSGTIAFVGTTGVPWGYNTQIFAITGSLSGGDIQAGQMSVTLTHYRWGSTTLEATVSGSARLTY